MHIYILFDAQAACSDEQRRGDLGLCQTYDASAAIKPVHRPRKKGLRCERRYCIL